LPSTVLGLFQVTRNADGTPAIQQPGTRIVLPARYTLPANAPQRDSSSTLDTSDARLGQAVAARDPARGDRLHIWTQHTVAGGAGALVRWYEIDPASRTVVQTGDVG